MHTIGTTEAIALDDYVFEFNRVSEESIEVTSKHKFVDMLTIQTFWTDSAGQLQFGERIINSKGRNYPDLEDFMAETIECGENFEGWSQEGMAE